MDSEGPIDLRERLAEMTPQEWPVFRDGKGHKG